MTEAIVGPTKTRELHNHHFDSTIWNGFRFRDDDIVISTYAKAGTTWTQQIVAQLLLGPDPNLEVAEMSPWLDLRIPPKDVKLPMVEAQTHRRFLKTHLPLDALVFSPKAKYIYIIGRRKPINKIVLGPIHSLHEPNGTLAVESGWYEPDYVGPQISVRLDQRVEGMRTFERDVRRYLAKSRYRTDLENSLRRYGRILDSHDWNNAFVQLWGLLEHLTDTTRSDYKATSKRAMFLYPQAELPLHRQVLAHLAHHRNRAVHAGYVSEDAETLLYQLKRYVEGVLRFHLFAGIDFASPSGHLRKLQSGRGLHRLVGRLRGRRGSRGRHRLYRVWG
jgi:hypothetical protein